MKVEPGFWFYGAAFTVGIMSVGIEASFLLVHLK
jgi:hypothetical protein